GEEREEGEQNGGGESQKVPTGYETNGAEQGEEGDKASVSAGHDDEIIDADLNETVNAWLQDMEDRLFPSDRASGEMDALVESRAEEVVDAHVKSGAGEEGLPFSENDLAIGAWQDFTLEVGQERGFENDVGASAATTHEHDNGAEVPVQDDGAHLPTTAHDDADNSHHEGTPPRSRSPPPKVTRKRRGAQPTPKKPRARIAQPEPDHDEEKGSNLDGADSHQERCLTPKPATKRRGGQAKKMSPAKKARVEQERESGVEVEDDVRGEKEGADSRPEPAPEPATKRRRPPGGQNATKVPRKKKARVEVESEEEQESKADEADDIMDREATPPPPVAASKPPTAAKKGRSANRKGEKDSKHGETGANGEGNLVPTGAPKRGGDPKRSRKVASKKDATDEVQDSNGDEADDEEPTASPPTTTTNGGTRSRNPPSNQTSKSAGSDDAPHPPNTPIWTKPLITTLVAQCTTTLATYNRIPSWDTIAATVNRTPQTDVTDIQCRNKYNNVGRGETRRAGTVWDAARIGALVRAVEEQKEKCGGKVKNWKDVAAAVNTRVPFTGEQCKEKFTQMKAAGEV
ncbi:hypothetical protein HK104_003608, partial [Borealophlyctis nickersoniae]